MPQEALAAKAETAEKTKTAETDKDVKIIVESFSAGAGGDPAGESAAIIDPEGESAAMVDPEGESAAMVDPEGEDGAVVYPETVVLADEGSG